MSSSNNNNSNRSNEKPRETPIPITIVTTANASNAQPQISSAIRSNSVRGLNNFNSNYAGNTTTTNVSSQDYESQRPFSQTRYGSSNLYNRTAINNNNATNITNRSSSISKLYNTISSGPSKTDYMTYESYSRPLPTNHHRTSILLENFNEPRSSYLASNPASTFSTAYRTSYDRY